jgi:hypothetical protein
MSIMRMSGSPYRLRIGVSAPPDAKVTRTCSSKGEQNGEKDYTVGSVPPVAEQLPDTRW